MNKFKIFLVSLILTASSSIALATEKKLFNLNLSTKTENSSNKKLNIEKEVEKEIESKDLKKTIKTILIKTGFLAPNFENKNSNNLFMKISTKERFTRIPYYVIERDIDEQLKKQIKNFINNGQKVDYSKIKINLPKNCINQENNGYFVYKSVKINLKSNGEFKYFKRKYDFEKTKKLQKYFKISKVIEDLEQKYEELKAEEEKLKKFKDDPIYDDEKIENINETMEYIKQQHLKLNTTLKNAIDEHEKLQKKVSKREEKNMENNLQKKRKR